MPAPRQRKSIFAALVVLLLVLTGVYLWHRTPAPADRETGIIPSVVPTAQFAPVDRERLTTRPSQEVSETTAPTTNAASIYRQAFALYDDLSADQRMLLGNWRTNVEASVEAELCGKLRPICDLMHQAATVTNCDWGLDPLTFESRMPQLAACRNLARAAVWSAAHCRADDWNGENDDLVAILRLGEGVSGALIGHLVDTAIQGIGIDFVREHADIFAGGDDTRLVQLLSDSSYEEGFYRSVASEADMVDRLADKLAAMSPEALSREMDQGFNESGALAQYRSRLQSETSAELIAQIRTVADLERQYGQALASTGVIPQGWDAQVAEFKQANPFFALLWPPFESILDRTQAMTVSRAMVVAGLAVAQDGPAALQTYSDPATGQPFAYTETPDGFQLQSGYQSKGKPLTMEFK